MRIVFLAIFVATLTVPPALAQEQPAARPPHPVKAIGDAQRGEALAMRWCASCHLTTPHGAASDSAPPFAWIAQQVRKNPNFGSGFLNHPHAPMPPLDLDRQEIADISAYFRELAK